MTHFLPDETVSSSLDTFQVDYANFLINQIMHYWTILRISLMFQHSQFAIINLPLTLFLRNSV